MKPTQRETAKLVHLIYIYIIGKNAKVWNIQNLFVPLHHKIKTLSKILKPKPQCDNRGLRQ